MLDEPNSTLHRPALTETALADNDACLQQTLFLQKHIRPQHESWLEEREGGATSWPAAIVWFAEPLRP